MTEAGSAGPACRAGWALHSASAADLRRFEDARPGDETQRRPQSLSSCRATAGLIRLELWVPVSPLREADEIRRQLLRGSRYRPGRAEGTLH